MPLSIDREIAKIRAEPGSNWLAMALKKIQEHQNQLSQSISTTTAATATTAAATTTTTAAAAATPTTFTPTGDLMGTATLQRVIGLCAIQLDQATVGSPSDGQVLVYDSTLGAYTLLSFADAETPVDSGDHIHYTLAHSPDPASSLLLFRNGLNQAAGGSDFTLAGAAITMTLVLDGSTDTLLAWYRY